MRPFEILDTSDLVNALAEYTARYTRLHAEGGKEKDLINCKETIQSMIAEIELRKSLQTLDPAGKKDR